MTIKTIITIALFTFSPLSFAQPNPAEDSQASFKHGSKVHENHCLKCHTDSVYTRENRIVKSINALGKQVRICRDNTDAPWFADDTNAVVEFLNKKYYQF